VRYTIHHKTTYLYESPATLSHHLLHLRPRNMGNQLVKQFSLEVHPSPAVSTMHTDYHGNMADYLTIGSAHDELKVIAKSEVEVTKPVLPDPQSTPPWESVRSFSAGETRAEKIEISVYLFDSPMLAVDPAFAAFALESFPAGCPLLQGVINLIQRINQEFRFDPRATTVATPVHEVLRLRRGVCQDFAHLGIICLRSLGIPARYVSGYIETIPPAGRKRLVGADASHAWFSAWCPGYGWIDADPTNNLLCADRHITVAWGRDFSDVSPLRGIVLGGGEHKLKVEVDVLPLE